MRDAEGVANPRPGHTVNAGVGDGALDRLLQHGAEHAEVMDTGLGVGEGRIAQTPVERLDVIEGSGVRTHQRPPPITEATAARWRGVRGVRARRSPANRPAARALAMTGSTPSSRSGGVSKSVVRGESRTTDITRVLCREGLHRSTPVSEGGNLPAALDSYPGSLVVTDHLGPGLSPPGTPSSRRKPGGEPGCCQPLVLSATILPQLGSPFQRRTE